MELTSLIKSLVAFRTEAPPGEEEECAKFIRDVIADMRIEGTEITLDKFEHRRANLVARMGPEEPGLLLAGHIDVVPAGDESAWSHPPYDASINDGRIYGRGTADMKGGLGAMLKAIESSAKNNKLKRGLLFVATAGEEVGFEGLKSVLDRRLVREGSARFGVLGEPTGLRPVRAHRGGATFKVKFQGKSGHASRPELGVNAIEMCASFVAALSEWSDSISGITDPDLGPTIATSTVVRGGTKSNVIPETCELTVDSRWIPEHGSSFVKKGLESVAASLRRYKAFDAKVEMLYDTHSLKLPPDHPLVVLAESVSGEKSETAPYGTEAALYTKHGIPSIVLGPGSIKQAHVADEYVKLSEVQGALSIYGRMIEALCLSKA